MKTIYVVRAAAGLYDSHTSWSITAFESKKKAEQFAAVGQELADKISKLCEHGYSLSKPESNPEAAQEAFQTLTAMDPAWRSHSFLLCEYDEPQYYTEALDLIEE